MTGGQIMKCITLNETPYQNGLKYGKECAAEIRVSIDTYTKRYLNSKQITWEDAKRLAKRFEACIKQQFRDEMQGIADGAGLTYEEILALNVRSEILYSGLRTEEPNGECTAFSAVAPATKDGSVYAGQTWDYSMSQREAAVMVRYCATSEHPNILMIVEAGMLGGKGINDAGISITINALSTHSFEIGIPLHIRMRMALEQKNLADAFHVITKSPIPTAGCLILTHKDGLSIGVELDPDGFDVLMPNNGILAHTNHFVGPRMTAIHKCSSNASSYIRYQRINQLMQTNGQLMIDDLKRFTADHAGYPYSICKHPDHAVSKEELALTNATNHAFIADLTNGIIYVAEGNPCESVFETIKLY